jgi:hypothetical protein
MTKETWNLLTQRGCENLHHDITDGQANHQPHQLTILALTGSAGIPAASQRWWGAHFTTLQYQAYW